MKWISKPPLGTPLNWAHPLNKGLAGFWLLNEGMGNKAYDISGNNNHGTLTNMAFPPTAASGWNPSRKGIGLQFDGENDYVEVSNSASISPTEAITVEYWVSPQLFIGSRYQEAIRKSNDYLTGINPSNQFFFTINNFAGGAAVYTVPALNQWYHIVGTYDRVNQKLYANGILRDSSAYTAAIGQDGTTLRIGTNSSNSENFDGTFDKVRIWNRALSASKTQELYINPYGMFL